MWSCHCLFTVSYRLFIQVSVNVGIDKINFKLMSRCYRFCIYDRYSNVLSLSLSTAATCRFVLLQKRTGKCIDSRYASLLRVVRKGRTPEFLQNYNAGQCKLQKLRNYPNMFRYLIETLIVTPWHVCVNEALPPQSYQGRQKVFFLAGKTTV